MVEPIIFLVAQQRSLLEALEADISRWFGNDCRILCENAPAEGLAALEALEALSAPVAQRPKKDTRPANNPAHGGNCS